MSSSLLEGPTSLEYFRVQVDKALEHQRLEVSAFAAHYLVDLLQRCIRTQDALPRAEAGSEEMPLAIAYLTALRAANRERARLLRAMGDTALFVSGFFADSLVEKVGDLRYYRTLGGDAYARLSHEHGGTLAVFAELAARFRELADILSEVSEASRTASSASVVRLYESWLQTGSRRTARLLLRQGITPMPAGTGLEN